MLIEWCKKKGATNVSENVMLVYLSSIHVEVLSE